MSCCNRNVTHTTQRILAEGIGTFILSFCVILSSESVDSTNAPTFEAVGFCLAALIYGFEHIASNFNPAVTLGAFLQGSLSLPLALAFVAAQSVGGTLGGVVGNSLRATPVPSFNPSPGNYGKAFAAEALYTGALVLVMQATGLYKNAQEPNSFFGLSVGFVVAAGAATVSRISGGCFNPAIGFAIDFATLSGDPSTFQDIWLYWLAPMVGAIFATIFSRAMHGIEHAKWSVPGWFCRCRCLCLRPSEEEAAEEEVGPEGDTGAMPLILPIAEFVGTFFLTLTSTLQAYGPSKALTMGFLLTSMVYALDHVCGADFNPAVTLGVALRMGRVFKDRGKILTVFLAQFGGAFAGATVTFLLNGGAAGTGVQFPAPNGSAGAVGAVFFEGAWTAFLVYTVCAVMTDVQDKAQSSVARRGHSRSYHGLAIGFVLVAGIFCAGKNGSGSGGTFNPALGVATAVVANVHALQNVWIYVAGPFAGSLLGASLFTLLHLDRSISVEGITGAGDQPPAEYAYVDSYESSSYESRAPYI